MNKYEILGVQGEGAYGVVLKCKNKENNTLVAIKKFKDTDDDEIIRKNTQREVRMLRMLKHQNIVELQEAFKRKGRVYLVFEYMEHTLLDLIDKSPQGLDPEKIKNILYQLIKSLAFMHNQDIIHRDVKPENLLINKQNVLKICDFGFARSVPQERNPQITHYVATRWYRSPELLLFDPYYGKPADMWAVGCIMAEMISGEPLFPGDNEIDQLHQICKLLGNLPENIQEIYSKNPRFVGIKMPNIEKPETIERKFLGKLSKKALSFIKGLLNLNPKFRFDCNEALNHPYFEEYSSMKTPDMFSQKIINQEKQNLYAMQNDMNSQYNYKMENHNNQDLSVKQSIEIKKPITSQDKPSNQTNQFQKTFQKESLINGTRFQYEKYRGDDTKFDEGSKNFQQYDAQSTTHRIPTLNSISSQKQLLQKKSITNDFLSKQQMASQQNLNLNSNLLKQTKSNFNQKLNKGQLLPTLNKLKTDPNLRNPSLDPNNFNNMNLVINFNQYNFANQQNQSMKGKKFHL